jgi:hypothetical protein
MAGQRTNLNLEEIRSYLNEGYEIFLNSKKKGRSRYLKLESLSTETTKEIVGMQKTSVI